MNRSDLQELVELRIKEAKVLLDAACYDGAYYLAGYAVECALKACIAKRTKEFDFPDRNLVKESYTHDLQALLKTAGLRAQFLTDTTTNPELESNWRLVARWSEDSRYQSFIPPKDAEDLYSAIIDPVNGVLPWLKMFW